MVSYRSLPRFALIPAIGIAAGLCLLGCSGGIAETGSPGGGQPGTSVSLGGSLGNFPLPPGARLIDNVAEGGEHDLVISGVTAAEVSSFYTSALPRAGYTISENNAATGHRSTSTAIEFSGHGYQGEIGAVTGGRISGIGGLKVLTGNVAAITLAKNGH